MIDDLYTIDDVTEYDPELFGARCSECVLRGQAVVVPPEIHKKAELLVIAEAPGETEEVHRRPLVGASGKENAKALRLAGLKREDCSYTNTLLCRPKVPAGNMKAYMAGFRLRNRQRKAKGKKPHLSPFECCFPRLLKEIKQHDNLLLLGKYARRVVYGAKEGAEKKLMASRGFPDKVLIDEEEKKVLSTVHPALVLRQRRWTTFYQSDVAKAVRMARGELNWKEPEMVFFPKPDRLRSVLSRLHRPAYDVETSGIEPTDCILRCIGIGDKDLLTCVPLVSVESPEQAARGMMEWYTPQEAKEIVAILKAWFEDEQGIVCDQNGLFDKQVMESAGFLVKRKRFDTVIGHHLTWSELGHSLAFQIAQYTDAPAHKEVDHDKWESDYDYHKYCMLDVAHTSNAAQIQAKDPKLLGQKRAFEADMYMSEFCRELHKIGIYLDAKEQLGHIGRLQRNMDVALKKCRAAALNVADRMPDEISKKERDFLSAFNPRSSAQKRDTLFTLFGMEPVPEKAGGRTDSGVPSTSRDCLYYLMDRGGLPPELETFMLELIEYQEQDKLRQTCASIKPLGDGRIHSNWKPHVVVSGRLATSDPNVMNIAKVVRSMFAARPGFLLVACDKAQLELRIISWLSQDEELIKAFLSGADVHKVNACGVLGYKSVGDVDDNARKFTKTFVYAVQYGAAPEKAWQMIKNFRDKHHQRPYRDITRSKVESMYKRWWRARKAVASYYDDRIDYWRQHGYMDEPIHGRRRYFLDGSAGEEQTEAMKNFSIQAAAAADMNDACKRTAEVFPWGFAGESTGIVHYNYDSLMLEVPARMALKVGQQIQEVMYSSLGDMPLPVDLAIGPNWGALEEPENAKGAFWADVEGI